MLRSLIYAAAFYIVTGIMLVGLSWLLVAPRSWAMAGLKLHARIALWLLEKIVGTKMEVRGRENLPDGPVLVVAKHQSTWDTFALIPLFSDPAIVLKDELKWIPFYGWFCVKFRHILVKRGKAAVALKALVAEAKDRIAANRQVVIFPEGTRTAPGAPPDYKPGFVALYDALGVPTVPLALNSGLFWPRRKLMRYPGTIVVSFLPAIPSGLPRKLAKESIERAIESETRRLIDEAQARQDGTAIFIPLEK
jgi:1-acyl-sn-glycerol-3-phosphate acyltransferase